ncbi:MAG: HTH domain-containing protein [Levilactobacillus sp.]|jgi:predicted DNA-binding transcriptional regulator YafY|uniref:helix-turn-helix transcriptional regulator n=1 Tax=Levilactobacillus sp. TaxID=2767919 RepID=UPI00258566B5|nr:HTH domain-containing protein [Levilactobacillus sp.]MCI1553601.1 HTH domain-containing protein [Levilactobacillus sp.]MCI1599485.1 HTH domain-containing protein [Levilactobacillus sp.]MCI1605298.1 HTH domain-containing protein [Levilactobacillus sp.]
MNKTARVNTMMRYINNRQFFTIRELMTHFHVSRSTVIRDLNNIQELGMPLTASVGRDGGYAVLQNQLLPAVQFNSEELKALFVSFLATLNTQLPYLQNRKTLTEKLVAIASQTQQDDLLTLQELLVFSHTNPANTRLTELTDFAPPMLKTLLNTCLTSRQVQLTTASATTTVWVRHVYNRQENWFVDAWDLTHHRFQEIAVTAIQAVAPVAQEQTLDPAAITAAIQAARPRPNVVIHLQAAAIQQFRQHPHPTAPLQFLDPFQQTARLECALDVTQPHQLADFTHWLLYLGPTATLIQAPTALKTVIRRECQARLAQLS